MDAVHGNERWDVEKILEQVASLNAVDSSRKKCVESYLGFKKWLLRTHKRQRKYLRGYETCVKTYIAAKKLNNKEAMERLGSYLKTCTDLTAFWEEYSKRFELESSLLDVVWAYVEKRKPSFMPLLLTLLGAAPGKDRTRKRSQRQKNDARNIKCPICGCTVKEHRLKSHIAKSHPRLKKPSGRSVISTLTPTPPLSPEEIDYKSRGTRDVSVNIQPIISVQNIVDNTLAERQQELYGE